MRRVGRVRRGFAKAIGAIAFVSACLFLGIRRAPPPSPDLLNGLASLGTGLLLAYVIEAVWITPKMRAAEDYQERLGVLVGVGTSGLIGVVLALFVAAHRAAGHRNALDDLGVAWIAISLAILGAMVVLHPLLVHEWAPGDENQSEDQ